MHLQVEAEDRMQQTLEELQVRVLVLPRPHFGRALFIHGAP